ncbi:TIR domain-containing protein [Pseudoroseomonas sp. WGS1072]|uniref:TIR domain-containing protein n=1 Tax=Roseomonas sp. WGS1072 TaxID=3366816 RepID=UPI003BF15759
MNLQEVRDTLLLNGFVISHEREMANGQFTRLDLEGGSIVNVYNTGTINVQGRADEKLRALFAERNGKRASKPTAQANVAAPPNRRVFVVYGHDTPARTSLEAMLRRWHLEPVILDQLPSEGQTIIEKLESTMDRPCFAVVLATPDDQGHRRDKDNEKMLRARQNVVLELGMMLAKLGRSRVAILLKDAVGMERPSDIQGLLYIPFENDPSDAAVQLAKEMHKQGIRIDLDRL